MQFVRTTEVAVPEVTVETGSVFMVLASARSRIDPLLFFGVFADPGELGLDGLMEAKGGC